MINLKNHAFHHKTFAIMLWLAIKKKNCSIIWIYKNIIYDIGKKSDSAI